MAFGRHSTVFWISMALIVITLLVDTTVYLFSLSAGSCCMTMLAGLGLKAVTKVISRSPPLIGLPLWNGNLDFLEEM